MTNTNFFCWKHFDSTLIKLLTKNYGAVSIQ